MYYGRLLVYNARVNRCGLHYGVELYVGDSGTFLMCTCGVRLPVCYRNPYGVQP